MSKMIQNGDNNDDNLWMTSTQFSQLLDKQEACLEPNNSSFNSAKLKSLPGSAPTTRASSVSAGLSKKTEQESKIGSYLDSESLLPFTKLKEVRLTDRFLDLINFLILFFIDF